MGSGASTSEGPRPGAPPGAEDRPGVEIRQRDVEAAEEQQPQQSHITDVQSLRSEDRVTQPEEEEVEEGGGGEEEEKQVEDRQEEEEEDDDKEKKEEEEEKRSSHTITVAAPVTPVRPLQEARGEGEGEAEGEEVSLDFESFLHSDGTLYSCFSHHGNRVYVDESQNLQPFPAEWYSQGRFLTAGGQGSQGSQAASQQQATATGQPLVSEDDRYGSVYIQGRGIVVTYMFQERVNTCRFWDPQSAVWLPLPLQWELNVDFVQAGVQRVMSALPGLVDQKEIVSALRQCNYDPEEVISVYLAMFGETLLQMSGDPLRSGLDSFRALLERDKVIEELKQKVQSQRKEAESLFQRNGHLARQVDHLSEIIQHLNHRLAELEAAQQEKEEKFRSLLSGRSQSGPPAGSRPLAPLGPMVKLRRVSRELNVSGKQLRSATQLALSDMKSQLEQLQTVVGRLFQAEQKAQQEAEEVRLLYRKEAAERRSLYNRLLELQGNIRVFCRCRRAAGSGSCLEVHQDHLEVALIQKGGRKKFLFDKVYPPNCTQEDVFEGTLPVITSCVDGYNVCILAYGQTGSGKTFTMMGTKQNPGVNIRSIRELLRICAEKEKVSYSLKISMLEIYNDTLKDLLAKSVDAALDIRVQGKSVSVPGLTKIPVRTEADILVAMETGEGNRRVASTRMNTHSSRSHLLVALEVEGSDQVTGQTTRGTLSLCDLAGSERISRTEAEGQRLVEAAAINKSLTALGQVFGALRSNALHVPFRNSKLTHVLQPCLSGDAKCCVLVNVSPDLQDAAETLSTLQFGSSIRQVTLGKATQNVVPAKSNRSVK